MATTQDLKQDGDMIDGDDFNYSTYGEISTFAGDESDGTYNDSGDLSAGVYNYDSFTLTAGNTCEVTDWAIIKVTGNVTIAGDMHSNYQNNLTCGAGILGSAPASHYSSYSSNTYYSGGGGLGYGGLAQNYGGGYCGIRELGLEMIKQRRGWFTGAGTRFGDAGGAILLEVGGTTTISGSFKANGEDPATGTVGTGGGCLGILGIGDIDLTGASIEATGGDATNHGDAAGGGGGGAFVAISFQFHSG